MPARRLDKDTEGEKVLEAMRTRATTAFDALVQLLNRAGGFAPFKGVNAH